MCHFLRLWNGMFGRVEGQYTTPKTQKIILDATLLNTQYYKIRIKGKVEQSKERSSALSYIQGVVAIKKGAFGSPSTMVINFILLTCGLNEKELSPLIEAGL